MKKSVSPIILMLVSIFAITCFAMMCVHIDETVKLSPQQAEANTSIANPINVNTATVQEFQLLPGIGENLANKIVTYRQEHGTFRTISELSEVPGIGPETLREISKYITVGE